MRGGDEGFARGRPGGSSRMGLPASAPRHGHVGEGSTTVLREVPVLPVVIPVAAVVLLVLLARLRRRGLLSAPRAAVAVALCVYAAGVVANTVFPIHLDLLADRPPWRVYFSPGDYEVADAVTNMVVFAPLGVLIPLLVTRPSFPRVLLVAAALSLTIETTQLVTAHYLRGGHVADVSDLACNVVGAALGFAAYVAVSRVPVAAGAVDRFRWR